MINRRRFQVVVVVVAVMVLALGQVSWAGLFDWIKAGAGSISNSRSIKHIDPNELMIAEYDLLNSQLVDQVAKDAPVDNVLEALDWLKMSTGEMPLTPGLVLPSKTALIKFTNLIALMDPDSSMCNMRAYNILTANELATGTTIAVTPGELPAQRRIEAVIYEVALRHAIQCRWDYPEQFAHERRQCDEGLLKDIQRMMHAMIATSKQHVFKPRDRQLDPRHVLARKARGITGTGTDEARALLMHVRATARDHPEARYLSVLPDPRERRRWIVNEAKVVQLLDKFVYSRCEFLEGAYHHIFKPAEYDQRFFSENNKYRAVNENTAELMAWLEYYRLCELMLADKHKLNANVLEAIWSELKSGSKG